MKQPITAEDKQRALWLWERLGLDAPLVVFDYETTSKFKSIARVFQVSIIKVYGPAVIRDWSTFVDPGRPIPAEVQELTGYTDTDVIGAPKFAGIAKNILDGFAGCYFAGYNVRYDLDVTQEELRRCGIEWEYDYDRIALDGHRLWQVLPGEGRTLTDALRVFCGERFDSAHGAPADVSGTLRVLVNILTGAGDALPQAGVELNALQFPRDPAWLDKRGKLIMEAGEAVLMIGKHKGSKLRDVPASYLKWMLRGDFPADVKAIVAAALKGEYPSCES